MLDYGFYNMDCMEGMKQFPDNYFDLAIVDPVYGDVTQGGYMHNLDSTTKLAKPIQYHLGIWNQEKTGKEYFDELLRVSKNQIIWGAITSQVACQILSVGLYGIRIERADFEIAWTSFDRASRMFRFTWNGMLQEDMKHKEKRIHPTQKPVALYEWLLDKFAEPDDVILDTHVGSASSLIAFNKTGHNFVGFELDDVYYQQAKERYERETAQITLFNCGVTI